MQVRTRGQPRVPRGRWFAHRPLVAHQEVSTAGSGTKHRRPCGQCGAHRDRRDRLVRPLDRPGHLGSRGTFL